jgi:hypothetical protein
MEHLPFLVLMKEFHTIDCRPDPKAGDFTDPHERLIAEKRFLPGARPSFAFPIIRFLRDDDHFMTFHES